VASLSVIAIARGRAELVFGTFGATLETEIIAGAVIDTVQVFKVASVDIFRVLNRIKPLDATVKSGVTAIDAGDTFSGAVAVEIVPELTCRPADCLL